MVVPTGLSMLPPIVNGENVPLVSTPTDLNSPTIPDPGAGSSPTLRVRSAAQDALSVYMRIHASVDTPTFIKA